MENEKTDVIQDSSPVISSDVKSQPVTEAPVEAPVDPQPKGSKTPEANLYAALEEERKLRKEAEQRAKEAEIKATESSEDVYSDEGKILKRHISSLEEKLNSLQEDRELQNLQAQYPAIKDKLADFNEFRKDYPKHKLENVDKIFLVERELATEIPKRLGLEKTVAGPKAPPSSGMNVEDVANLRKTNYKKYLEMITSGKLNPLDIK